VSSAVLRQRADLWLFRARFARTRAAAAQLIAAGGVRLVHAGAARRLEKPSTELVVGDALVFAQRGRLITVRVEQLAARRGPAAEARTLYRDLEAEAP
jgi:ribosome-associated heat shock protein Hsp15